MQVRIRFMESADVEELPKLKARWYTDPGSGDWFLSITAEDFFAMHQSTGDDRTLLLDVRQMTDEEAQRQP